MSSLAGRGLAVYVHWPYCHALCTYCNFNKYKAPAADSGMPARMAAALQTDLATQLAAAAHTRITSGERAAV